MNNNQDQNNDQSLGWQENRDGVFQKESPCDTAEPETEESFRYPAPYAEHHNRICLCHRKSNEEDTVFEPLCNFLAWIEAEIVWDNGAEVTRMLEIAGEDEDGQALPVVSIPAEEFSKLVWLSRYWPPYCSLEISHLADKHFCKAVRATAKRAKTKYVYTQTGWHQIDGIWQFLIPGDPRFDVRLLGNQKHYRIEPCDTGDTYPPAVLNALLDGHFIPREIFCPGLAYVFLSPLNEILRQAECEPKFLLLSSGKTGSMKSTIAALWLSFFGDFTPTSLPMSFRDTANSIFETLYVLKDLPTVVDDYHPATGNEGGNMKAIAQAVTRAVGDRAARNRSEKSGRLQTPRIPHCNAIITAEHIPDVGESGLARFFVIDFPYGAIDPQTLSLVQEESRCGTLRKVGYLYLTWLAGILNTNGMPKTAEALGNLFRTYRDESRRYFSEKRILSHGRTDEAVAWLRIGYYMILKFLKHCGIMQDEQIQTESKVFCETVLALAARQSERVNDDKPTHIYIRKLMALIDAGEIALCPKDLPTADSVHSAVFYDDRYYYVSLDMSHSAVSSLCYKQGESFPISSSALAKALREEGLIDTPLGRNTQTERCGGRPRRVMLLRTDKISEIMG